MGLDISVNVKVGEALEEIRSDWENELQKNEAIRILEEMGQYEMLSTKTGSYAGLHVLRREYARMKTWTDYSTEKDLTPRHLASHLLNHSDCDGWYLPEKFDSPVWCESDGDKYHVSIGSSYRLLEELCEMLAHKDQWPEDIQWRWDALFVVAIASSATRTPVEFH